MFLQSVQLANLWAIHFKSPTAALAVALKRTEQKMCGPASHQQRAMRDVPRQCFRVRSFWLVLLFGLRNKCQQGMLEVLSSGDEDDTTSLVESFFEDEELARTPLS